MAEKGHALHMETWLIFHVGCIEGMAEKGHTIHENLACFTCWGCSRASNTLYMETWLALYVGCIVQLHTLHESRARFPGKAARRQHVPGRASVGGAYTS